MNKAQWRQLATLALQEQATTGKFDGREAQAVYYEALRNADLIRKAEVHAVLGFIIEDAPRAKVPKETGPRHWLVKFMKLGMEPPHPFGRTSKVVCAESRDGAKGRVEHMASEHYPITASLTDQPVSSLDTCYHRGQA